MKTKLAMVTHGDNLKDDRASALLAAHGFELEWFDARVVEELPDPDANFAGTVVYGGPESVNSPEKYMQRELAWAGRWVTTSKPFLGLCLGAQLLGRALGEQIISHAKGLREIGFVEIRPAENSNGHFFDGPMHVYEWHREGLAALPKDCELLATNDIFPIQAYRHRDTSYGLQFHPETSPEIRERWMSEAADSLTEPGAHDAERQRHDSQRYDRRQHDWFVTFLEKWVTDLRAG